MKDDDRNGRDRLLAAAARGAKSSKNRDCLDSETLARYVERLLSGKDRERVETHLASCDTCRELFAEVGLTRAQVEALPVSMPTLLRAKLQQRFLERSRTPVLEIVFRAGRRILERVTETGGFQVLEAAPVRGPGSVKTYRLTLSGHEVNAAVDRQRDGAFELWLKVAPEGTPQRKYDWQIWSGSRLIGQQTAEDGETLFTDLKEGTYSCVLRLSGREIGAVNFTLEEKDES